MRSTFCFSWFLIGLAVAGPALASGLLFEPKNSAVFAGADPNGHAAMMASVTRPKERVDAVSPLNNQLSPSYIVRQSILAQYSAKVNEAIFGKDGQATGTFSFEDGSTIAYERLNGQIVITFNDPINGRTQLTLPTLTQ